MRLHNFPSFVIPNIISGNKWVVYTSINVSKEHLMYDAPTNAGSTLCQTLQVCITSDTQKIESSDWPKWCHTVWHNMNSCLLSATCRQRQFSWSNKRIINTSIVDVQENWETSYLNPMSDNVNHSHG